MFPPAGCPVPLCQRHFGSEVMSTPSLPLSFDPAQQPEADPPDTDHAGGRSPVVCASGAVVLPAVPLALPIVFAAHGMLSYSDRRGSECNKGAFQNAGKIFHDRHR